MNKHLILVAHAAAAAASMAVSTAQAGVVVAWNFDGATAGQLSNIAASTQAAGVSSAAFQAANNGVTVWGSPVGNVLVTQFFDAATVLPSLSFTLDSAFDHLSLSFKTWHNHTASYPTAPKYNYAVQINNGSGWADIAADLVASMDTTAQTVTLDLAQGLGAGHYDIRWIGYGYAYGSNSNTDFFALDDVVLTSTVPEPASLALAALALAGAAATRRRRA